MSNIKGGAHRIRLARINSDEARPALDPIKRQGCRGGIAIESQSREQRPAPMLAPQVLLADLPGSRPGERLRVALGQTKGGRLTIDLREQRFDEGIGWFDQRSVSLEPSQFKRVQAVLGLSAIGEDQDECRDESPATIPFPGLAASSGPRRPCAGRA